VELTVVAQGRAIIYGGSNVEGRALLHLFLVFLVSFRRVPLQQRREYHVAIKAQDIRAGSQRSL
jgi:hypothetical protein